MSRRIIAFIAFVLGGLILVTIECGLNGFARAMGGMSVVSRPDSGFLEALTPWLTGLYFLISAIGSITVREDVDLTAVALIAHIELLFTFIAISSGTFGSGDFPSGIFLLMICTLAFTPWLAVWYWFLSKPLETKSK